MTITSTTHPRERIDLTESSTTIGLVDYLILRPKPHLIAHQCISCGAHYFDRRNACARCSGFEFVTAMVPNVGEVVSFTIVAFAAPEVKVPFVAAVVRCADFSVAANIINTQPDPDHVRLGMAVRLATYSLGTDHKGVEAIAFGYEPIGRSD
jgi:uncharacterized OB-fold protein